MAGYTFSCYPLGFIIRMVFVKSQCSPQIIILSRLIFINIQKILYFLLVLYFAVIYSIFNTIKSIKRQKVITIFAYSTLRSIQYCVIITN